LDLVVDFNYFSFSHPIPHTNPTHLTKHESLSLNRKFSQRIQYVEYYSVHAHNRDNRIADFYYPIHPVFEK